MTETNNAPVALGAASDVGKVRDENEDAHGIWGPEHGDWDCLIAVADGVGGHEHGKQASELVLSQLVSCLKARELAGDDTNVKTALEAAVAGANASVFQNFGTATPRPGSTLTCALVTNGKCYVAHVGDSRAYMIHSGQTYRLTTDHSWVQHQVSLGHMTEAEAAASPYRNQVLQVLGSAPDVEVDVIVRSISPGDIVIICSDGVSEYVEEGELVGLGNAARDASDLAESMVALAVARGGSDNATVVVAGIPVAYAGGAARAPDTADLPTPHTAFETAPPTSPSRRPAGADAPTRPFAVSLSEPSCAPESVREPSVVSSARRQALVAIVLAAVFVILGLLLIWLWATGDSTKRTFPADGSASLGPAAHLFTHAPYYVQAWLSHLGVSTLYIETGSQHENDNLDSLNGKLWDEPVNVESCLRPVLALDPPTTVVPLAELIDHWFALAPVLVPAAMKRCDTRP